MRIKIAALTLGSYLMAGTTFAAPITVTNVGYYLDTVGTNSIGIAGGGTASGTQSTLFIANTSPGGGAGGTTASATYVSTGNVTAAPVLADSSGTFWARRALNPGPTELDALNVVFVNGGDSATVGTGSLTGRAWMPLAIDFLVSGDPFQPLLSWTLPTEVDIDRVQIVFHNDDTNLEITRATRNGSTTGFQLGSVLPSGVNIVFDLRLIDLDERIGTDDNWGAGDILSTSRTYISYTVPNAVPEPGTAMLLGIAAMAAALTRRRNRAVA